MECGCPSSWGIENGHIHFLKNRCTSSIQRGIWHTAVSITNWRVLLPEVSAQMPVWWSTLYVLVYIYARKLWCTHKISPGSWWAFRFVTRYKKNNIRSTLCGPGSDQLPSVHLLLGLPTASSTWNVKLQVIFDTAKGGGGGRKNK